MSDIFNMADAVNKKTIDPQLLAEVIRYDPYTGNLHWLPRAVEMFKCSCSSTKWNARFAGKEAFFCQRKDGYLQGRIGGRNYLAHRVIWALVHGAWPQEVDHINGNRSDNRIVNLRAVTSLENKRNMAMKHDSRGPCSGVNWVERRQKWRAVISVEGSTKYLGVFADKNDAMRARAAAEMKYGFHPNHSRQSTTEGVA